MRSSDAEPEDGLEPRADDRAPTDAINEPATPAHSNPWIAAVEWPQGSADGTPPQTFDQGSEEATPTGAAEDQAGAVESQGLLHDSLLGKALLSVMLLALTVGLAAWNMPKNDVRDDIRERLAAPVNLTGLNQGWEVFAPNPPRTHVVITARITYDDGTNADFGFPEGEPFLGAFREYRWRKWERRLRISENSGFRAQSTDWIAREMALPDKQITEVMLVETQARTPTIGSSDDLVWKTTDVYRRTFDETSRPRGTTLD